MTWKERSKWFLLYGDGRKQMIFLYHQEQLEQLLADSVRIAFLKAYGYGKECLEEKLKILSLHMKKYYNKAGEFPHEIGVFLGYPQGATSC